MQKILQEKYIKSIWDNIFGVKHGDALPTQNIELLKLLLGRAISKKQWIILKELKENEFKNQTKAIISICKKYGVAESTIRWNYKKLELFGMVEGGTLTEFGEFVLKNGRRGVVDCMEACGASGPGSNPGADPKGGAKNAGKISKNRWWTS